MSRLVEFEVGQWIVNRKSKKLWQVKRMDAETVTLAAFPLTEERHISRTHSQVFNNFRVAYSADWKRANRERTT